MINKLTPDQGRRLDEVREEWLQVGLATGPADRLAAEAGVRAAYTAAGLQPPTFMIWLDSPLAGAYGQAIAPLAITKVWDQVRDQVWAQVGDQVRDQVGDQVGDQVRDQVRAQVWAQVGAQVRDQVWDQVWAQVGAQVWDQVWAQVRDQVWAQVRDQARDQVRAQVRDQAGNWYRALLSGQHDAGYLAFYAALEAVGVTGLQPMHGLQQVARNAGWWWCYRDVAVLTERPGQLHRDNLGRLHCEHGPAVVYPDGWDVWSWHGTAVPADLISDGWDTTRILRESNAEVRRCAIERLGWGEFITSAGLTQVGDTCPDPGNPGHTLALYDVPERIYDEHVRVLLCTNATVERDGTRRQFGLTVPAPIDDPIAAAAWTFNVPAADYAALTRAS